MAAGTHGGQERASDSLKLESHVVSLLMWVLGTEPGSSGRTTCVFIAMEPVPGLSFSEAICVSGTALEK